MMNATGNETLDRIQQEIKESLRREEELRKNYSRDNSLDEEPPAKQNGFGGTHAAAPPLNATPTPKLASLVLMNGLKTPKSTLTNGASSRRFAPNPSSKGMMQKFLKMRGKLGIVTIKPESQPSPSSTQWTHSNDDVFEPAKVTMGSGRNIRNGFVSAEEKMRKELLEFQRREAELRKERRKSQPDLMAALEAETEIESNLKPARSMVQFYSTEDLTEESYSAPASLKPARSLADLCDASDDDLETPGTHSLIMQFESMKTQQARA